MKKFLLILIIAVIACAEVEEKVQKEDKLKVILHDFLNFIDFEDPTIVELGLLDKIKNFIKKTMLKGKELIDKVKNAIEKGKDILEDLKDSISQGVDLLKKKGIWDEIVKYVKTGGKLAATTLCSNYLTPVVCAPLVEIVFNIVFK